MADQLLEIIRDAIARYDFDKDKGIERNVREYIVELLEKQISLCARAATKELLRQDDLDNQGIALVQEAIERSLIEF